MESIATRIQTIIDNADARLDDEHEDRQYIAEDILNQLRDLIQDTTA